MHINSTSKLSWRQAKYVFVRINHTVWLLKGTKAVELDGRQLYAQPTCHWREGVPILQGVTAEQCKAEMVYGQEWGAIICDEVQGL